MEVVGGVASVATLLELTGKFLLYIKDVKHGPVDRARLIAELDSTKNLLEQLQNRITNLSNTGDDATPKPTPLMTSLAIENGPFDQYHKLLKALLQKVGNPGPGEHTRFWDRCKKVVGTFRWPFDKKDVDELFTALERLKNNLNLALTSDLVEIAVSSSGKLGEIAKGIDDIKVKARSKEDEDILDWISPISYRPTHEAILENAEPNTAQWFFESHEFKEWAWRQKAILWCPGIPGAGKTTISALTIKKLENCGSDQTICGFIYCCYDERAQKTPFTVLSNLLQQALRHPRMCRLPQELRAHYQQFKKDQRLPNEKDILGILKDVVSEFATFYVILDALDECTNNEAATLELIDTIWSLNGTVKLMCTSRPVPVFERHFEKLEKTVKLEISAHTDDIKLYVKSRVQELQRRSQLVARPKIDITLENEIIDAVTTRCQGMFLLAKLHLDSLAWQLTAADIRKSLKALPQTLDETYKAALHRIRSQSPEANLNKTGETVLFWVVCAQRPLAINELRHAYAALNLSEGQSITEEDLPDEDALTSLCCGLLSVDKESETVRMVHYTTKEHFQSSLYENEINDAHLSMTKSCLSYLMQLELRKEGVLDRTLHFDWQLWVTDPFFAFLQYASLHWASHIQHASDQQLNDIWPSLIAFLSDKIAMNIAEEVASQLSDRFYPWTRTLAFGEWAPVSSACYYAARFDIPHVLQRLLGSQDNDLVNVNDYGPNGVTLLMRAARCGADKTVELLLCHGADPNIYPPPAEASALHFAVEKCKDSTVSSLLEAGAHLESVDLFGRTPLRWAVGCNRVHVAKLLIDAGAEINTQGCDGVTPIFVAVERRNGQMVDLLLNRGANPSNPSTGRDNHGDTPLHLVARLPCRPGSGDIARALINAGADLEAKERSDSKTPLIVAAENGQYDVVNALLDAKADVNARTNYNSTALHWAALKGHSACARLLINGGADVNARTICNHTPLYLSARNGNMEVLEALLQASANVDAADFLGRIALHGADFSRKPEIIKLLLNAGADVNAFDNLSRKPLDHAIRGNNPEVVELLLDAGADYDHKSYQLPGSTPVHLCVRFAGLQCAKLLIDIGADLNALDHEGNTPLAIAIYEEKWETTELLMDAGATLDGMSPENLNLLGNAAWGSVGKDNRSTLDKIGHLLDQAKVYYREKMAEYIPRGSYVYITAPNYRTPLAGALIKRKWRYAKQLLEEQRGYFKEMQMGTLEEVEALIRNESAWIDPDLLQRIQKLIDRARECWEQRRRDGLVMEETSGTGTRH